MSLVSIGLFELPHPPAAHPPQDSLLMEYLMTQQPTVVGQGLLGRIAAQLYNKKHVLTIRCVLCALAQGFIQRSTLVA